MLDDVDGSIAEVSVESLDFRWRRRRPTR